MVTVSPAIKRWLGASNSGLMTLGAWPTMTLRGTPMQLAICAAPGIGDLLLVDLLDVHDVGKSDRTNSAFLAVASVACPVVDAVAGPAKTIAGAVINPRLARATRAMAVDLVAGFERGRLRDMAGMYR